MIGTIQELREVLSNSDVLEVELRDCRSSERSHYEGYIEIVDCDNAPHRKQIEYDMPSYLTVPGEVSDLLRESIVDYDRGQKIRAQILLAKSYAGFMKYTERKFTVKQELIAEAYFNGGMMRVHFGKKMGVKTVLREIHKYEELTI